MHFLIQIKSTFNSSWHEEEGMCYGENHFIEMNGLEIWFSKTDGYMYSVQHHQSLKESFLQHWYDCHLEEINQWYTEEERIKYDNKYPLSAVAKTPESWGDFKSQAIDHLQSDLKDIRDDTEFLPYGLMNQMKVMSAWIQDRYEEDTFEFKDSQE
jgi:hypothetical protein